MFTKSKEGFYDGTGRWIEIKSYDLDFSESGLDDNVSVCLLSVSYISTGSRQVDGVV